MGDAVAVMRAHPRAHVHRVPSASVQRTPPSPADISMDVSAVQRVLGLQLTPFAQALSAIFGTKSA